MLINISIRGSDTKNIFHCWYNDFTEFSSITKTIDLGHVDDDCKEIIKSELQRALQEKFASTMNVPTEEFAKIALQVKAKHHRKYVCVHGGTSANAPAEYYQAAKDLGKKLAELNFGIVYGGGNVGMMGALADGALAEGGKVVGVITPAIRAQNVVHKDIVVYEEKSYEDRKRHMANIADGFITMPGGMGTLDEFTEVAIHNQFALFAPDPANPFKPVCLLNIDNFFEGTQKQLEKCVQTNFYPQKHADQIFISSSIDGCIGHIKEFKAPEVDTSRWWDKQTSPVETMNQQRRASGITVNASSTASTSSVEASGEPRKSLI